MSTPPAPASADDSYAVLAELYDAMYAGLASRERELDFWRERCARPGVYLELGCGTGRVMLALLEQGIAIHGLDRSGAMLDRLRTKAAALSLSPRLVRGDMRRLALPDRFAGVLMTQRVFHHLIDAEAQLACLRAVAAHLGEGGQLVIECVFPAVGWLASLDGARRLMRVDLTHPRTGEPLCWYQSSRYQAERQQIVQLDVIERYDRAGRLLSTRRAVHTFKVVFPHELEHALARAGLRIVARHGGFDRAPLGPDSALMLTIAERRRGAG